VWSRHPASITNTMPRSVPRRCAYVDCQKRSNRRSFGQSRTLTPDQLLSHFSSLKYPNDGVVCNYHYTLLQRQLDQRQRADVSTGLDELLAAAAAMADTSSSAEPSDSPPPVLPGPAVTVTIRSQSLPPQPLSLSTSSSPVPLRRSTSTPLLPTCQRGCDPRQRKRIAFTCAMSGVTWTTWNRLEANLNSQSLSKATWYRLTQDVWRAIEAVRDDCSNAYTQQLLAANQPIVVVADGAWSHRGYTAGQHDWVLFNAADNKAIFSIPLYRSRVCKGKVVHDGNYDDGSSKGMEGYALDIAISRLQMSGLAALITGWVGDQDSSVLKQLRECPAAHNWQVHLDPGHAKKNLVNALANLFGEKKAFDGLARRIPAFVLRCTKRAEKEHAGDVARMREQFLQWLDCVVPHYTQSCGATCPHHQQDDIEQNDASSTSTATSTTSKTFLNTTVHGSQIASLQSLIDRMKRSARYFIHGFNTCNVERYHRERLKLTPKMLEFWKTWAPRCALNQVFHNCGYAETHRLVLAKLGESPLWMPCIWGVLPGNRYLAAMDAERAYHSARKSQVAYNRRKDQLAREFGKRRAAHDRASQYRGHDYQHSPPLYTGDDDGEVVQQKRKPRRSKAQIAKEKAEQEAEDSRRRALFDGGDVTFTTLGVIDVNLPVKKKGRKKKKRAEGEENEPQGEESSKSSPTPSQRKRRTAQKPVGDSMMAVEKAPGPTAAQPNSSVARAIMFR
jgi:hypothetical protein